jgi:hypothetical protein
MAASQQWTTLWGCDALRKKGCSCSEPCPRTEAAEQHAEAACSWCASVSPLLQGLYIHCCNACMLVHQVPRCCAVVGSQRLRFQQPGWLPPCAYALYLLFHAAAAVASSRAAASAGRWCTCHDPLPKNTRILACRGAGVVLPSATAWGPRTQVRPDLPSCTPQQCLGSCVFCGKLLAHRLSIHDHPAAICCVCCMHSKPFMCCSRGTALPGKGTSVGFGHKGCAVPCCAVL